MSEQRGSYFGEGETVSAAAGATGARVRLIEHSTETPFESGNDGVSEQKDGDDDGDVMVGNFSKVILNLGSSW